MPALPLDEAGKYVAGAYLVFMVLILVYVAIMAAKIARIERDVTELLGLTEGDDWGAGARDEEVGSRDAPKASRGEAGAGMEVPAGETGRGATVQARPEAVQARRDAEQPSQDAGLESPRS